MKMKKIAFAIMICTFLVGISACSKLTTTSLTTSSNTTTSSTVSSISITTSTVSSSTTTISASTTAILTTAQQVTTGVTTFQTTTSTTTNTTTAELLTVVFVTELSSYIPPQLVVSSGSLLEVPEVPESDDYVFLGWYKDSSYENLWNFSIDLVTENMTLYGKWEEAVPEGTPISTLSEFNTMATSGSYDTFYLSQDLDFEGYTWNYLDSTFRGELNGNGKVISNLTINGTGISGIFSRLGGAYVHDLILSNVNISSVSAGQRAGLIAGQLDADGNVLENIQIFDSSVHASRDEGAGALLGQAKKTVSISNIIIVNTSISNNLKNAGGLIGQVDGTTVTISDCDLNIIVIASERAGGLIGEIKNGGSINTIRVVLSGQISATQYVAGIIGRNQVLSSSLDQVFFTGTLTAGNTNLGHISGDQYVTTVNDVFMVETVFFGTPAKQMVSAEFIVASKADCDLAWWNTHLTDISENGNWYYDNGMYHLSGMYFNPPTRHEVTFVLGHDLPDVVIEIIDGQNLAVPEIDSVMGYAFAGFYSDIELLIPYDFQTPVLSELTLYAKWEEVETYSVSIDGVVQLVSANAQAIEPDDPVQSGKIFVGWFVEGVQYDFNLPVETDLTLVSVWTDATLYTITFDSLGGSLEDELSFYENQHVGPLPKPSLTDMRFYGWYMDVELTTIFNLEYLSNDITLYARYVESGVICFEEDFDYPSETDLSETTWTEVSPGNAVIIDEATGKTLKLTEIAIEASYTRSLVSVGEGRYVLVFDFKQALGGASFTIELLSGTSRVFTVGANRANRLTYRNPDGTETAIDLSIFSITPDKYYRTVVVFDTEYDRYKYFIIYDEAVFEATPLGGLAFMTGEEITDIKIRIVGHNDSPSAVPESYLRNILIESSSETADGKSIYDPEEAIDIEALLDQLAYNLEIPFAEDTRGNLFLFKSMYLIPIVWSSSNTDYITNDGLVTRPFSSEIQVVMTATFEKAGITRTKEFVITIKPTSDIIEFLSMDYSLTGFALGNVSIPTCREGDNGYYVVSTPKEFMDAINAENNTTNGTYAAKIIEITADLDMGYLEVTNLYGTLRNFESHNAPKIHPVLLATGVGKIVIQDRDGSTSKYNEGLMIFSASGNTIRHAGFSIKRSHNIIIRNLKFSELWEWDEATKGDYDSNDWDYFTIDTVNGIWFDHIELEKSYDGLIDFKAGSSVEESVVNATFSYMSLIFETTDFVRAQFDYLEANKASFNYYNQMRLAGMTKEEIQSLNSFQKKGFLLGGSELRVGNVFTLSIYNSYVKNLQDRFPRLRGGDVHIFNCIYDATDIYEIRNYVRETYPVLFAKTEYNRQLTNQALVTTENGAIYMQNSIIYGVTQVIKSNQVGEDHPLMTGKYLVEDSLYVLGDYVFYGSSEDEDTAFIRANLEPILPFSWTTISGLPYSNQHLIAVNVLESYLETMIVGTTGESFNWFSTEYE